VDYVEYRVFQNPQVDVDSEELLYLGDHEFKLYDNIGPASKFGMNLVPGTTQDAKLLVEDERFYASKPLFYSLVSKLKEYIIKETLISILGLRDLLMPIFFKMGIDLTKATDSAAITRTINEVESKINEAVDTSMLLGEVLDISALITAMFSITRVIPDPGNMLSQLDELNLDPINKKLETIIGERDNLRDTILESVGIPPELFDGGSNQYEVLTRSQRYESTVGAALTRLKKAYRHGIVKLYVVANPKATSEEVDKINRAKLNLFRVSSIDINRDTNLITTNQELADNAARLIGTFDDLIKNNPLVKPEEVLSILKSTMSNLGTDWKNIIVDEVPKVDGDSFGRGGSFFSKTGNRNLFIGLNKSSINNENSIKPE
jgi:hypothetical protein